MKLNLLPLGVAIAVCTATPLAAQTLTTWDDPVNVAASAGTLTKSGGCDGCPDSGAYGATLLTGDGYAEFIPAAGQRLYGGLGNDLSSSTASSTINYSFSIWPTGAFEIRELGVYKGEGMFVAGDKFRVAVENGVVVYRKNGTLVYTSAVAPAYPLVFDTSLYSLGASLSGATVVPAVVSSTTTSTTTTTPTSTSTTTTTTTSMSTPVRTSVGPYFAVTDRNAYAKPPLPSIGPAGSTITDPVFQSTITRITDANTRPGTLNASYRTPSSPHQNAWSANVSYFYVVSGDGSVVPFAFNAATGTAARVQPTTSGAGGMVLNFYIEPQFSYVNDSIIYGSVANGNLHTIDQYDFSTGAYTQIVDLETIVAGLSGTYIGGVASSAGSNEMIMAMFGGTSQDHHHLIIVFPRANPSNYLLVDTWASTINGVPASSILNFSLHHVAIDRSGRYLMLYPTSADQTGTRQAPQSVAWDTQTGVFTEMPAATHPYGHDSLGYGVSVNQDCCVTTSYDGVQWQFRNLSTPATSSDVLPQVLQPKEVYISDHSTWHNARSDKLMPYISGLFRYGTNNTTPWRALDDEIVAVETDAIGQDPTIWRFAHHRSNVANDTNPSYTSFWYEPRPNVSHDGQWVLFTSNWEKTLGTDPTGDAGTTARQDVFLVQLAAADSTTTTATTTPTAPAPAPVVPVAIGTTSLPSGRVTVPYSAALQATGGSGTYTWSVSGGALPVGLSLNSATGAVSGTPAAAGTASVTITATDSGNATNKAVAAYTVTIGASPVAITSNSLPVGRVTVAYSATLQASGGSGAFSWSVASGALPAGVTLSASNGALSGTPTAAGNSSFTIAVADSSDAANTTSAAFVISIGASPVAITTTSLPGARATTAYNASLQAAGGTGTYSWAVKSGALPTGLNLSTASGAITGTAQSTGTSTATIAVSDANDATNIASATFSITITAAPVTITTTSLASGRMTVAYSATMQAAGGGGTYTWSLASGALPGGLSLNGATGAISGTPTAAGTFTFSIEVVDASDATNTRSASYSIAVAAAPVRITTTSLPAGRAKVAYSATESATGGSGTFTWAVASGALPGGLILNSTTGAIAGTPSSTSTGTFTLTIAATDAADATNVGTMTYSISISAAVKITSPRTIPNASVGVYYSYQVIASNVQGTTNWDIAGGAMPPGITLNPTTGVISGTCYSTGTWYFNVRVFDVSTNNTLTLGLTVQ